MTMFAMRSAMVLALALTGVACSNPTVDPNSTFTIHGKALAADGAPLANTDVKIVRYYDKLHLVVPTIDALFACTGSCNDDGLNLELAVVTTLKTGADGSFSGTVTGNDIKATNGITDAQGKVEVSSLLAVVLDPTDANRKAGVYSFEKLFEQADKDWSTGDMKLWNADAKADATNALTNGLVRFSWKAPPSTAVDNFYRVEAKGSSSARLVVNCRDRGVGSKVAEGGCDSDGAGSFFFDISLYALYNFYSDNGVFDAYVGAIGADFRYRAKLRIIVPVLPDPAPTRLPVAIGGIWAVSNDTVSGQGEQNLVGGPAVDGNRATPASLTPNATSIYVLFNQAVFVSDAGLINAVVAEAKGACVNVEFSSDGTSEIGSVKMSGTTWETVGRFCGATASATEMTAILGFDSTATASPGRLGHWMRFKLIDDANVSGAVSPTFSAVGEIVVYGKKI